MIDGPQEFEPTPEWIADLDSARAAVDAAIKNFIQVYRGPVHPNDPPYIQGWVVGAEWTNMWTEQENKGVREIIAPQGQMLAITEGLGWFIARA